MLNKIMKELNFSEDKDLYINSYWRDIDKLQVIVMIDKKDNILHIFKNMGDPSYEMLEFKIPSEIDENFKNILETFIEIYRNEENSHTKCKELNLLECISIKNRDSYM